MYRKSMPDFAERFKELRGPLTQRAAGYKLDITDGMIQKWERRRSQPSLETLHKIADATGAPVDYIIGRTDDWEGRPLWWDDLSNGEDDTGGGRGAPGRGPDSPTADLDSAVQRRRRGDEPPKAR